MTRKEAIKWLSNLKMDIGKTQHQELWHYEQAIDEIIEILEQERLEIIRCKNCRHNNNCEIQFDAQAGSEFFCGLAERK